MGDWGMRMSRHNWSGNVHKGPTMATTLRPVATPGEEIRQARLAQGLSQEELGRRARVSAKTIGRIERGQDYGDPRSIPAVRAALGLDSAADDLSQVSAEALAAELVRRLVAAEHVLQRHRITTGDVPIETLHSPDTIVGPPTDEHSDETLADG
jgi:transcriptional regulator with XRE-family HTH domain